jgi:hypothetical protein
MAAKYSRTQVHALGFDKGLAFKVQLEAATQAATLHFNAFVNRHGGRLRSGLVPDVIKALPGYVTARNGLDAAVAHERAFNGVFCPTYRKELSAHRQAARQARLAAEA